MASLQEGTVKVYSLDQVIYFLEQRQQTEDWNIRDAAIAYLKGYREVLPEYAQMKLDAVKNEPLTWDELRQMEGEPVWIETDNVKFWTVVDNFRIICNQECLCCSKGYMCRSTHARGDWQAYRKERK